MHKYAINSRLLGDSSLLAWSNLGCWQETTNYLQACQNLALHLGDQMQLCTQDSILDLGCGQGASLKLWHTHYSIQTIYAVELQASLARKLNGLNLPAVKHVYSGSFLNLNDFNLTQKFSAIVCIDAVYHSCIFSFLNSMLSYLKPKGRLGFHCLCFTEKWQNASRFKKMQYFLLLKCADINIQNILSYKQLEDAIYQRGFKHIHTTNLSKNVLCGFANYLKIKPVIQQNRKIKYTAKFCELLYKDGFISYMQVVAY